MAAGVIIKTEERRQHEEAVMRFWRAGQRDSGAERSSGGYRSQKQRGSKKPEWR